jgi:sulfatase maturation enzyme AslB (radical SAM superfamily)
MTRILCLGNNTEDTDTRTQSLADQAGSINHGLLSELDGPLDPLSYQLHGYYHTSVYDMNWARLVALAKDFDSVIMLDQPKNQWSHPNAWLNTIRFLSEMGGKGKFIDPSYLESFLFYQNLVQKNPSFCIHPFIQIHTNGSQSVACCLSNTPIADIDTITNFKEDLRYQKIRQKMIQGELLPNCTRCYDLESINAVSERQVATVEWANHLNLTSLADLESITSPVFYDIRPSNKCNLRCRMCQPHNSHLIEKEYKMLKLIPDAPIKQVRAMGFEIIQYNNLEQVMIAGGEPTVMPEVYQWLDDCVKNKRTNFAVELQTNGTKLSSRLKQLITNFDIFNFVFSIDAYGKLNRYIRWPSDWDTIIENWQYLRNKQHHVTLSTTLSIYSIWDIGNLFEFIDKEFPGTLINFSIANQPSYLAPTLFPDHEIVLDSLYRAQRTQTSKNFNKKLETYIDYLIEYYKQRPDIDIEKLKTFFKFNDQLDQSRSVYLKDHIPVLENFRNKIND